MCFVRYGTASPGIHVWQMGVNGAGCREEKKSRWSYAGRSSADGSWFGSFSGPWPLGFCPLSSRVSLSQEGTWRSGTGGAAWCRQTKKGAGTWRPHRHQESRDLSTALWLISSNFSTDPEGSYRFSLMVQLHLANKGTAVPRVVPGFNYCQKHFNDDRQHVIDTNRMMFSPLQSLLMEVIGWRLFRGTKVKQKESKNHSGRKRAATREMMG